MLTITSVVTPFVSIFIAMGPPLAIPAFVVLTEGAPAARKRRIANEAVLAAFLAGVIFLAVGRLFFSWMGITESDFRIGGGVVLLVLSVSYLANSGTGTAEKVSLSSGQSGAVPLGIPLIMGPAAITTIIIAAKANGWAITLSCISANLLLVWLAFRNSDFFARHLGLENIKIVSKISSLLLVSLAVAMIRVGIKSVIAP